MRSNARCSLDQLGARHVVVATGGGTFVDPQNRAAINADGVSVWLDVPLDRADRAGSRPTAGGRWPPIAPGSNACIINGARHTSRRTSGWTPARASVDALVEQLVDWLEH